VTFDGQGVTVADATGVYANADFVTGRLGQVALLQAKTSAR
jgi:hypothetical protein